MNLSAILSDRELAQLTSTLELYARATGKDLADIANRAGRQTAIFASAKTKKADPAAIENELRKQIATLVFGKTGKRLKRPKAIYKRTRLANAIVRARANQAGKKLTEEEVEAAAQRMIVGRKRAVGFIRSGYIPALQTFGARRLGGQRGKPKGRAVKATPERKEAMLSNEVQGRKGGAAVKVGDRALAEALRDVEADMRRYAEKKLAERTAAANRRR